MPTWRSSPRTERSSADALLAFPRLGMINVHASLLPALPRRGARTPGRHRGRTRDGRHDHADRQSARRRSDARDGRDDRSATTKRATRWSAISRSSERLFSSKSLDRMARGPVVRHRRTTLWPHTLPALRNKTATSTGRLQPSASTTGPRAPPLAARLHLSRRTSVDRSAHEHIGWPVGHRARRRAGHDRLRRGGRSRRSNGHGIASHCRDSSRRQAADGCPRISRGSSPRAGRSVLSPMIAPARSAAYDILCAISAGRADLPAASHTRVRTAKTNAIARSRPKSLPAYSAGVARSIT